MICNINADSFELLRKNLYYFEFNFGNEKTHIDKLVTLNTVKMLPYGIIISRGE